MAELAADPSMDGVSVGAMVGEMVGPGTLMVRYATERDGVLAQRTGWWRREAAAWRCWFHQATTVVAPGGEASRW